MKIFIKIISVVLLSVLLTNCSLLDKNKGVIGKASIAEDKQKAKIEQVNKDINKTDQNRLTEIGSFSFGINYALEKIPDTNSTIEAKIAYDLNTRVIALANQPTLEAIKEMQLIVNTLITNNVAGKKLLVKKDEEVILLQEQIILLKASKDKEIQKYITLADETASRADQYKSTLSQMNSWFGLGAIKYGITRFIKSSFLFLIIGGALFLLLRLLSTANPIAAAIFSVFEKIVAWIINAIKVIFPKALSMAGTVGKDVYDKMALLLKKIVDNIQFIRETEKRTGKDITLKEILVELDKSMDTTEKAMVDQIKKELGY
jgi:hypothetical protein